MSWRPLSLRGKSDVRFDEPAEGMPIWLRGPVLDWVRGSFIRPGYGGPVVNREALNALQLAFRLEKPLAGRKPPDLVTDLMNRLYEDEEFALDGLDWMLHHWHYFRKAYESREWASELGEMLRQGGSAWEVTSSDAQFQLTRRAVGPVLDVLEHTATEAIRAHDYLATAWSKLTGRHPDPSGTYRDAVRAVEAVAKPVVLPANAKATLGQMIPAMRDKPEKWTTTLGSVGDVRALMEAVWTGQLDRHGTDDETVPLNVSSAEADAAFSICLDLVRQFVGGHVMRVA
jgi:hypothetical protein